MKGKGFSQRELDACHLYGQTAAGRASPSSDEEKKNLLAAKQRINLDDVNQMVI